MSSGYRCPSCGVDYEVPPKWCPCTPYPTDRPTTTWRLIDLTTDTPPIVALVELRPWRTTPGEPPQLVPADDLLGLLEWHLQHNPACAALADSGTGYALVAETASVGVETADEVHTSAVDLTLEEYQRLRSLVENSD